MAVSFNDLYKADGRAGRDGDGDGVVNEKEKKPKKSGAEKIGSGVGAAAGGYVGSKAALAVMSRSLRAGGKLSIPKLAAAAFIPLGLGELGGGYAGRKVNERLTPEQRAVTDEVQRRGTAALAGANLGAAVGGFAAQATGRKAKLPAIAGAAVGALANAGYDHWKHAEKAVTFGDLYKADGRAGRDADGDGKVNERSESAKLVGQLQGGAVQYGAAAVGSAVGSAGMIARKSKANIDALGSGRYARMKGVAPKRPELAVAAAIGAAGSYANQKIRGDEPISVTETGGSAGFVAGGVAGAYEKMKWSERAARSRPRAWRDRKVALAGVRSGLKGAIGGAAAGALYDYTFGAHGLGKGDIDRDGDGMVDDGTPNERPVGAPKKNHKATGEVVGGTAAGFTAGGLAGRLISGKIPGRRGQLLSVGLSPLASIGAGWAGKEIGGRIGTRIERENDVTTQAQIAAGLVGSGAAYGIATRLLGKYQVATPEAQAFIAKATAIAELGKVWDRAQLAKDIRDGDGDGRIHDGTPSERPAPAYQRKLPGRVVGAVADKAKVISPKVKAAVEHPKGQKTIEWVALGADVLGDLVDIVQDGQFRATGNQGLGDVVEAVALGRDYYMTHAQNALKTGSRVGKEVLRRLLRKADQMDDLNKAADLSDEELEALDDALLGILEMVGEDEGREFLNAFLKCHNGIGDEADHDLVADRVAAYVAAS